MSETMLKLGHIQRVSPSSNLYWIGVDHDQADVHEFDGTIVLGDECTTLTELISIAERIKADLDVVIQQARARLR